MENCGPSHLKLAPRLEENALTQLRKTTKLNAFRLIMHSILSIFLQLESVYVVMEKNRMQILLNVMTPCVSQRMIMITYIVFHFS